MKSRRNELANGIACYAESKQRTIVNIRMRIEISADTDVISIHSRQSMTDVSLGEVSYYLQRVGPIYCGKSRSDEYKFLMDAIYSRERNCKMDVEMTSARIVDSLKNVRL